jgi:hypothetical protein
MKQITQLENALTALKQIETLIREDCKNVCDLTLNQGISLGIIYTVLNGTAWNARCEVKEIHNG